MAKSEILGLFGTSPQQLRNEYRDSNMVSPAQMGSQGLLQQVVSMGGNAGSIIGTGIGGLLGGAAPGEREATAVDQAMRDAYDPNMTQAQRLTKMAEILAQQPGMGAQAMEALKAARAAQLQELQMKKSEQDLNPPYKDFKVETVGYEDDGRGGRVAVRKYITVTRKYNPETGQYEDMTPQEARDAGGGNSAPPATNNTGRSQSSAEALAKRNNPNLTPPPPRQPPTPTAGSRGARDGMTYGFEGQGMTNPEGF